MAFIMVVKKPVRLLVVFVLTCWRMEEAPPYDEYVDAIVNCFVKDMRKQYGVICTGSGGSMPQKINSISVSFYCYRRASVEEARILYINLCEELLRRINAHEKIRPFLAEYPLSPQGSRIALAFVTKNGTKHLDGSVTFVCQGRDRRLYYNRSELRTVLNKSIIDGATGEIIHPEHTTVESMFADLFDEPYEEALRNA